ncbi:MAG TPA: PorP/SprF family type IX secretion system membrane protein [Bacteroidales bacterium]|nr:PorP/SprF family type IX secretion system membrane protein [Bacteroidales bacterium]
MKRIYLFLIACLTGGSILFAQQAPLNYQYMIDAYSLNPAFAGMNGGFETYIGVKKDRLDADYSPRTISFDLNAPLGKTVAMGGSLVNDQAGIFRNTYASLSYSFYARFGENHGLSLALSGGINAKLVDFGGINVMHPDDPLLANAKELKETSLNYGAGILYHIKGLEIGGYVPGLYSDNNDFYPYVRHYLAHASYTINVAPNWQVEPLVVMRGAENSPWSYEGTAIVKYMERYYAAATYRKTSIGAFSIGGFLTDKLLFHYAYDFTLPFDDYKGVIGDNKGGHEIAIGYRLGGKTKSKADRILEELSTKSTMQQVDSLSGLTKDLQNKLDMLNDSISRMNREQPENVKKGVDQSDLKQQSDRIDKRTENIETDINALNEKISTLEETLADYKKKTESKFRVISTRDAVRDDNKPVDAGYYVVIGSFRYEANAKKAVEIYKDVNPFIIHNTRRGWYYVYSDKYDALDPALERMRKLRTEPNRFHDAWVHIYRNY